MPTSDHYVVLADVIDSREHTERELLGERLTETLEYVNSTHSGSIDTPFERIKGIDEFGGVLGRMEPVYDVIADILNGIHPVRARFGIASGRVDIGKSTDSISELDGPAFHRADRLVTEAESEDLYASLEAGRAFDPLVSNNLNLLLMSRERLTDRQVEVIRAYERHGTQEAAAKSLGVRQQSVSKTLKRAEYGRTTRIRRTLRETLEAVYDG